MSKNIKMVSWNVNGLRAVIKKGFMDYFNEVDADVFCLQEIKLQEGQIELELEGYNKYWNYAEKKGYSGTALFSKKEPISVVNGIGVEHHDHEGRVIAAEFDEYFVVTVYTPNSKRGLERLDDRMDWEDEFKKYLKILEETKPVIVCGDLNVAHQEIDLTNPKTNKKNAGFTEEERSKMSALLEDGFVDSFRFFNPDLEGAYSWWSYFRQARDRNIGWRIDYFLVSQSLTSKLVDSRIDAAILGSDHCPVVLEIS